MSVSSFFSREGGERARVTREEACRLLVLAVLATAVEDIVAGRLGVGWLEGAVGRHWCEWVDLEPAAVRRGIEGRLGEGRRDRRRLGWELSREQLAWAVEVHEAGATWGEAAAALGMCQSTLCAALRAAGYRTDYRTDRADRRRPAGAGLEVV